MSEFRLHLAEPEPKVNPPDIEEALKSWREINSNKHLWATFDAMQFEHERVVNVTWGYRTSSGMRETAIQTISYRYTNSYGYYYETRYTHP